MSRIKLLTVCLGCLLVLIMAAGCGAETDKGEKETEKEPLVSQTDAWQETTGDLTGESLKFFEIGGGEGAYSYKLFNTDGTVAEEIELCEQKPSISLCEDSLIKVTVDRDTYYYDLNTLKFSETFTDVYDQSGNLALRVEDRSVVVFDIFDENGFNTVLSDFPGGFAEGSEQPFSSVEFIEDGASVRAIHTGGDGTTEIVQCFNIANGTKFVTVDDWINKKDLITGEERGRVESFLYSYMGTVDYNTGCEYDYNVSGELIINGKRYFHCECFYLMEDEDGTVEKVPCAEFVLSEGFNERYDCRDSDGELIVYTENNMI